MVEINDNNNNQYFRFSPQGRCFYSQNKPSFSNATIWQMPNTSIQTSFNNRMNFNFSDYNQFGYCNYNMGCAQNTNFFSNFFNGFNMIFNFFFPQRVQHLPPRFIIPQFDTPEVVSPFESPQVEQVTSTADVDKINKLVEVKETPANVTVPPNLKRDIEKAQTYLLQQLPKLSDADLKKMGISVEKRDRIMEYLKHITYDTDHDTMQAQGTGIVVSTKCKGTDNLANMVTMLMHEANHCDEKYLAQYPEDSETGDLRHRDSAGKPVKPAGTFVNTKEEERACETLGLLTTAVLIENGTLTGYDNYGRYGTNADGVDGHNRVTKYLTDKALLKADVDAWVSGYTNYPEGLHNAGLTVEHLKGGDEEYKVELPLGVRGQTVELKAGDKVTLNGVEYNLGNGENGIVLSPMDSIPVFQVIPKGDTGNEMIGHIVFDNVPVHEQEKGFYNHQHNNQNCFRFLDGQGQEIVFTREDGTTIKGKFYP